MYKLFGILLLSMLFTGVLMIPFINLLYRLKFRNPKKREEDPLGKKTPIFNQLHGHKVGTPTGGGILMIISSFLFSVMYYFLTDFSMNWTSTILFTTLFLFGLLGLYDDVTKFFKLEKKGFWGLRFKQKFIFQWIFAFFISYLMYAYITLDAIFIPILQPLFAIGPWGMGIFFIPFAALTIVSSSNAFNETDGLDGLAAGLLVIALSAFWALTDSSQGDVQLLIAVIIGALIPFLYFNIYPARIFMGDTGALAYGALLAVIALLINQAFILPIIGGVFVLEVGSSLIQLGSKLLRNGKKVFPIAPIHHTFEYIGWDETKVTMRFWLAGVVLAFIGLFVATFGIS